MPLTLAQAKVGMADKVDQAVIDEFRRSSLLLDRLVFDNAVSPGTGGSTLTYGYIRLKTPSVAAGRALNSEYVPGEAIKEKATTDLKIMGGSFQVDRVLEDTAAQSEIAFQVSEKTKATANQFHNEVINGDSTSKETDFDGLDKILTGTDTEYKPTSGVDLSTSAAMTTNFDEFLDNMLTFISKLDGKPDMLLMNSTMLVKMKSVARRAGYYSRTENAFGASVDNWDGIPMVDLENYYDGTKTNPIVAIAADGTTDVYAVRIGLDGFHGVSPTGNKIIKTYLPRKDEPGAVKKGEVELVAGIALKNSKRAGVFRGIKVAPASN